MAEKNNPPGEGIMSGKQEKRVTFFDFTLFIKNERKVSSHSLVLL